MKQRRRFVTKRHFRLGVTAALLLAGTAAVLFAGAKLGQKILRKHVVGSAKQILLWEREGRLSSNYGYAWTEINLYRRMQEVNTGIVGGKTSNEKPKSKKANGPDTIDLPSLGAIRRLNHIRSYANFIRITDRNDLPITEIRTTHTRIKPGEVSPVFLKTLIITEDRHFHQRALAYDYPGLLRAGATAVFRSVRRMRPVAPRGTSTIHQQVARFLLSKVNSKGFIYSERSLRRKLQELRLGQALMMEYSSDEILEVYLNHCINAGSGLIGIFDISQALFAREPGRLDECQSLYLARLVKWNRNLPKKIIQQVKVDLDRIGPELGWDSEKCDSLRKAMDRLAFAPAITTPGTQNPLLDLANEYWLRICRNNGASEAQLADMDLSHPNTLVRRRGQLKIQLHIDARLQARLEKWVRSRGYGNDTLLTQNIRIGSFGENLVRKKVPPDTLSRPEPITRDRSFSEPGSPQKTLLQEGDTVIVSVRYKRIGPAQVRRSVFYFRRDSIRVPGQYYSYAIMNSQKGELLAYFSRDRAGSRLSSLLRNRTPNGSAMAKPILFALNYDRGDFTPYQMTSDSTEAGAACPWNRTFLRTPKGIAGVTYLRSGEPGGYAVRNHDYAFDGYDYIYNHLAQSNNIIGVEAVYRLACNTITSTAQAAWTSDFYKRLAAPDRLDKSPQNVTGIRLFAELARFAGARADSIVEDGQTIPLPQDFYSIALGTLELSLYEQMHLFNILYRNELIENPATASGLVVKSIWVSGQQIEFDTTVNRAAVFEDFNRIRPVHLALHKRLLSDPSDGLAKYDFPCDSPRVAKGRFESAGVLSNFAKSGTTDPILRPYDADLTSPARTNYGIWNAVLRLNLTDADVPDSLWGLSAARTVKIPSETLDVTVACIGECNRKNTGSPEGKVLHKFLTNGLLQEFGLPSSGPGFYRVYEQHLKESTPDSILFANPYEPSNLGLDDIRRIQNKTHGMSRGESDLSDIRFKKRFLFGFGLDKDAYLRLLRLAPYFGRASGQYMQALDQLEGSRSTEAARKAIKQFAGFHSPNRYCQQELKIVLDALERSLRK